jgi:HK97 family phage major capsid protein/HK97 family phage prohead protease
MNRAYATLTVKAVNEDQRIITGIATTPSPDRVGDIVEPLGVKFKNPLPLLHQHNSDEPVGTVQFKQPTKDGISFEARLPQLDEPPSLKDRIDTAWAEIKSGLVRGVSIGFRSLEHSFMEDGGIRFIQTEVLELSLVTIPANQDATIQTIKSTDAKLLAALGHEQPSVNEQRAVAGLSPLPTRPGAAGNPKPIVRLGAKAMPKPISEQITDFTNVRAEKAARMLAIMEGAGEKGETLDEAQQQEYDGLDTELKSIDEHLDRLRKAEKLAVASAKPVNGTTNEEGTASRGAGGPIVTSMRRNLQPGIEFTRYAMSLLQSKGNPDVALKIAENRYPDDQRVHNVLKAAVAAGTTTDPTWAGALVQYQDIASDFIDYLRPMTIIGKFGTNGIPPLRAIPFNVRVKRQTSGGEAYWVGEGQPKPLTSFDFDTVTLRWAKIANIAVLTDEQVRFSSPNAETTVRTALAEAIIAREDITFIDPSVTAIADTRPASITNGATSHASSGTDEAAARTDVGVLMTALANANLPYSQAVWIMNSAAAIQLFLMQNALGQPSFPGMLATGGMFMGRPVIVSDHIVPTGSPSTSIIVLMIPQEVYLSDDGQVMVDASREASLQMDDSPTMASTSGSPATPTATSVVSMFQTNSVAIRAERYINWARRRDAAVQYLTGVAYAA